MKKRVALVVNTLSGGGAEKTVSNLSLHLGGKYLIDLIVNDDRHLVYPRAGKVYTLKMPPGRDRMGTAYQLKAFVRRVRLLRSLKRRKGYEAVISFSEMANLANVVSGSGRGGNKPGGKKAFSGPEKSCGGKTVISFHNSVRTRASAGWKFRLMTEIMFPYMVRKADLTVSCSREIADELELHCGLRPEKSRVIYNGLDLDRIRERTSEPFTDEEERNCFPENEEKLLVTVGRLTEQKGQWHLLRAMRILRDEGIRVRLVVLGEGELRRFLEELTGNLGLADCVSFAGHVENPYKYLARADAAVFPSMYEGFSCAIIEALACGVPCVSTDHSTGAREILAPDSDYRCKVNDRAEYADYGVLVPVCCGGTGMIDQPFTAEERILAEAVGRVLTESELAEVYRTAGTARAQQLSIGRICSQWESLIENRADGVHMERAETPEKSFHEHSGSQL
ncbi:MAG: glycosyltransferase [Eubacteriales bacterium]|nr:glycosyltransferase [Eubacteriales bacterium]